MDTVKSISVTKTTFRYELQESRVMSLTENIVNLKNRQGGQELFSLKFTTVIRLAIKDSSITSALQGLGGGRSGTLWMCPGQQGAGSSFMGSALFMLS